MPLLIVRKGRPRPPRNRWTRQGDVQLYRCVTGNRRKDRRLAADAGHITPTLFDRIRQAASRIWEA